MDKKVNTVKYERAERRAAPATGGSFGSDLSHGGGASVYEKIKQLRRRSRDMLKL